MANQIKYQVGFDVQKQGLNDLKSSLQQLQKMKLSDIMKINDTDIGRAREMFKDISTQAREVEKALQKAFNPKLNTVNIQEFKNALSGMDFSGLYANFQKAGAAGEAAFRNLTTQVLGSNIQLKQSHALLDKMATTLGNTVKWHAASAAINGVSRSVQQAWGYVQHLDHSLNDIRIVTGKSAEEMGKFAEQANAAARNLGKTTTDYTDAALIFAQQGLSDQEIAKRSQITLKTANVTGQSADAVSEQLTAVWNGYKVNAEEAELYVDRLAAVAATTASDLEELSKGMGKVAAAANQMGVGEDQLAAQLSTIISVTRQAPESVGTALRTVYARISDIEAGIEEDGVTLGNYSGEMAKLGFNVLDANGKLRDMGQVIEQIGGSWDNLTREQQVNLAQTMAGQRQYSNLMALFENFDKYTEALTTAQNAAGTLQKQQNIYMDSTRAHLNELKAATEDLYNQFVDTSSINGMIDGVTSVVDVFKNFIQGIGGGGQLLKSLGAIGVTVFGQQIAQSIVTTINNFEQAKLQAENLKQSIEETKKLVDNKVGNDITQDLNIKQLDRLNLAGTIPDDLFNKIGTQLQEISSSSGQIEKVEQSIEILGNSFNSLGINMDEAAAEWGTLDDMLNSEKGLQKVKEALENLGKELEKLDSSRKKIADLFNTFENNRSEETFNNLKTGLIDFINTLETTQAGENGFKTLFQSLPSYAQQSIEEAKTALQGLDFSMPGAQESIKQVFQNIQSTLTTEISNVKELMKSAEEGQLQNLQNRLTELQNALKLSDQQLERLLGNANKLTNVQGFINLAGGMAQVARGIQQIQNLGSIWKNQDLTLGQKALQTITNLAFSLPMLHNGFKKVTTSTTLFSFALGQTAVAEAMANASVIKHVGKLQLLELQTGRTAIATSVLGKQVLITSGLLAGFGIALGVAALSIYLNHLKKVHEELIEFNKTQIQTAQSQQQEINSREQLYSSLEELNQQYKNHQISSAELKSKTQQLCEQYDVEYDKLQKLIEQYGSLEAAIKHARQDDNKDKAHATQMEEDAARNIWNQNEQQTLRISPNQISANDEKLLDILREEELLTQQINANTYSTDYVIPLGQGIEGYEKINELMKNHTIAAQDQGNVYKILSKYLQEHAQDYNTLTEAMEKNADAQQTVRVEDAIGHFDFDNIKNLEDFQKKYEYLLKRLDKGDRDAAKAHLQQLFPQIPESFYGASEVIGELKDRIGDVDKETENFLLNMSSNDLELLSDKIQLDSGAIKSWQDVVSLAQQLTEKDFSNIDTLKGKQEFDQAIQSASNKYNSYQQVEDKLKDGKSISKKEVQGLDLSEAQIQHYFDKMLNGQYKLTKDAEQFYNVIDNSKVADFVSILGQVNNQINNLNQIQDVKSKYAGDTKTGFNYLENDKTAEVSQVGTSIGGFDLTYLNDANKKLVQTQIDYLKAVQDSDSAVWKLADDCQTALDNSRLTTEQAKQLAQAYNDAGDQTDGLKEKNEELKQLEEQLQEQLRAAFQPLDEDIDQGALDNLSDHLQQIAQQSKDIPDYLKDDREAAEEFAESILRFNDAVDDVSKNFDDWMENLEAYKGGDQTGFITEAIEGLQDAYGDLLNIDGSLLPDSFLSDINNLNLMKAAIQGDTDAYNQLAAAASQQILIDIAANDPTSTYEDLKSQHDAFKNAIESNPAEVYVEGDAAVDAVQAIADAAWQSTHDVQKAMALTQAAIQDQNYTAQIDVKTAEASDVEQHDDINKALSAHTYTEKIPKVIPGKKVDGKQSAVISGTTEATGVAYGIDTTITPADSETKKQATATGLKVTKVGKGASGGVKVRNSKHKANTGGAKKRSGGGGGNSGGSKKKNQPKTQSYTAKTLNDKFTEKKTLSAVSKLKDPYFDINKELERQERLLKGINRESDKAFGKERIDLLKKEAEAIKKQNEQIGKKIQINDEERKTSKTNLKKYGFTFDENDDISNYEDVIDPLQSTATTKTNDANTAIKEYNKVYKSAASAEKKYNEIEKAWKQYINLKNTKKKNGKFTKSEKKKFDKVKGQLRKLLGVKKDSQITTKRKNQIQKQLKKIINDAKNKLNNANEKQKQAKEAEEKLKDVTDAAKEHQQIVKLGDDLKDQQEEKDVQAFTAEIESLNYEIQLKLDYSQAQRDWNDFKRKVINGDNIFNQDDIKRKMKDVEAAWDNLITYFQTSSDKNGKQGSLITNFKHLLDLQNKIQEIQQKREKNEDSDTEYGDLLNQAIEDYKDYFEKIKTQYEDINEYINTIRQSLFEVADEIENSFEVQLEKYENVNDLIEHSMDLLQLIYGQKNFDAMDKYYNTLHNNQLNQIDLLKQQASFWWQEWQGAITNNQTELAKEFEKKYMDTINNINSSIIKSVETLQDQYENAINKIFNDLNKNMTNNLGMGYVEIDWDFTKDKDKQFLDTIDAAYAIDDLQSKFQDLLDNTKSVKNQQNIKKVMDQQLENLKSKEKLTQYDIDRANQLLEIEQARAALEDAQAAKTQLRLKRDSQGNYSYEFTANQQATQEAERKLKEAQNSLYKLDKQQYKSNLDSMLNAWKDFQEQVIKIKNDNNLDQIQKNAQLLKIQQIYTEKFKNLTEQNEDYRKNLIISTSESLADIYNTPLETYTNLAKQEIEQLMNSLIPGWESGIQNLINNLKENGFSSIIKSVFDDIDKRTEEYKEKLSEIEKTGNQDFEDLTVGINKVVDAYTPLIQKNEDFAKSMKKNIQGVKDFVTGLNKLLQLMEDNNLSFDKVEDVYTFLQSLTTDSINSIWNNSTLKIPTIGSDNISDTETNQEEKINTITLFDLYDLKTLNEMAKEENREQAYNDLAAYDEKNGTNLLQEWLKKVIAFASGGYTGEWNNSNGKLALLHQKELVLNESDTQNLLDTISILKTIDTSLNTGIISKMQDIGNQLIKEDYNDTVIEQQVHIEASFPNVNSKRQIEEAFSDLVNLAAQRAMKQ